ncbi:hypothetical protein EIN_391340 [Entamoeba invadens IP1]|uniref:Uncharacterized protein n=1 Tax=Entamoeba invadens IP1 TaxID=370355 RepID=A0A0A1U5A9_ENTIV|nr:hypothetical protein EIN_391340 [Entamoeba invadens IP1]ELP89479.1 hypothetical protein EIN_391340 [Entamoeba invadens IP1]|eukprot:XP_004256250.1 hypothetical protein EIN_391340 [Entamoeba invadens IP1]
MLKNPLLCTKELTLIKRESKSYEAIQQAGVIALLVSNGVTFQLNSPIRFAPIAMQLFVVNDVIIDGESLNFGKMVEEQCNQRFSADSTELENVEDKKKLLKNIKRRKELNRAALSFNSLVSIAESFGYHFELKLIKSAKKTLQMTKIKSVFKEGRIFLDEKAFTEIGNATNKYITSLCSKDKYYVKISPFDKNIINLINPKTKPDHALPIETVLSTERSSTVSTQSEQTLRLLFPYQERFDSKNEVATFKTVECTEHVTDHPNRVDYISVGDVTSVANSTPNFEYIVNDQKFEDYVGEVQPTNCVEPINSVDYTDTYNVPKCIRNLRPIEQMGYTNTTDSMGTVSQINTLNCVNDTALIYTPVNSYLSTANCHNTINTFQPKPLLFNPTIYFPPSKPSNLVMAPQINMFCPQHRVYIPKHGLTSALDM